VKKHWWLWILGGLIAGILIAELYERGRYEWFAPNTNMTCLAEEIISEYDANEVAADNKYKNKRITIHGTIQSISKTSFKESCLKLGGITGAPSLYCYFGWEHNTAIAELFRGQSVKVLGTVAGKTLGQLQVVRCKLQ
jgi:hypothetical protein